MARLLEAAFLGDRETGTWSLGCCCCARRTLLHAVQASARAHARLVARAGAAQRAHKALWLVQGLSDLASDIGILGGTRSWHRI